MAAKKKKARKAINGRVLTAKNLGEASYQAIHKIPHGLRAKALHRLIAIGAAMQKKFGADWYLKLLDGKGIKLVR